MHGRSVAPCLAQLDANRHLALLGKFDGIPEQIEQHLPQPHRIPAQRSRHAVADQAGQLQPLAVGPFGIGLHALVDELTQVEVDDVDVELSRFDLGEVQDVVR